MRLAHLSDVHILDLTGVRWTRFLNKRVTGLANLIGYRKAAHNPHFLERAVAELAADPTIDHVVVTGDLSNLSLESEFRRAHAILAPLAEKLSVIPGNHDVYTRGAQKSARFETFFGDWMRSTDTHAPPPPYPWLKLLGPDTPAGVALIGFASAIPRPPLLANGRISPAQLARLAALAGSFGARTPVALVHHNVHARTPLKDRMRGLAGGDAFLQALAAAHVPILLHGHTHKAHRATLHGIDVIGCGSSTWASDHPDHIARYNIYTFGPDGLSDVSRRVFDPARDAFADRPFSVPT